MSSSQEGKLAEFQAWTGISDVAEAIMWLDNTNWDLEAAVNNAIPQETITICSKYAMGDDCKNEKTLQDGGGDSNKASSSSGPSNILELQVHYKSNVYRYKVPDSMTVGCLKTLIFSDTQVKPSEQLITGWPMIPESDETTLDTLNILEKRFLFLNASQERGDSMEVDEQNGLSRLLGASKPSPSSSIEFNRTGHKVGPANSDKKVSLRVYDCSKNKEHMMFPPVERTVAQFKSDVVNVTKIPVSQQQWYGWPENVTDSMKLNELDLNTPFHNLRVEKTRGFSHINGNRRSSLSDFEFINSDEHSASSDDFEDASEDLGDDIFNNEEIPRSNGLTPLIPNNVEDETVGSVLFIDGYIRRYGQSSPNFYSGSLEDAVRVAFCQPSREKRMLAIYLHHDGSILTNVFCSMLLGSEAVLETLGSYFVIWGWDITNRANKEMLLDSVSRHLGRTTTEEIEDIRTDNYPAILIVSRFRSTTEVLDVVHGNIGVNELLSMLIRTVGVFVHRQESEIMEEESRAERDRIKFEQDRAYQESLQLDKAKDEAIKRQILLKTQEEERLKREEEQRQAEKLAVESSLPEEPSSQTPSDQIMTFRFRTPTGEVFVRKFFTNDKLQVLFNFLLVKGFRIGEYKVLSPFPFRIDISTYDGDCLLKDAGLCAQETFVLEEK